MNPTVLFVDDERDLLNGFQRLLHLDFTIDTATSGEAGLEALSCSGPFAVVISDMQMPGMSGVQFLTKVRERWPDTVRVMLTGHADIQTAIDAVNDGCIFRFLTKPCAPETLRGALNAAIGQYGLVMAEKELQEQTLHGSVKVLTEILALVNPAAFSRSTRIHRTVKHIAHSLGLREAWRYEVAAMLSQIGCVALDTDTVEAVYAGTELPAAEIMRFKMHPSIAFELLHEIPRLQVVATMIAGQLESSVRKTLRQTGVPLKAGELGAHLLRIAVDYDQLVFHGTPADQALEILKSKPEEYYSTAVATLETLPVENAAMVTQEMSIRELTTGMILDEDVRAPNGTLMVARDQKISYPLLVRIRNLYQKSPMLQNVKVKVPAQKTH
jgi:response regulator RpfG family c-di-GMP phosphodiesterase